MTLVSCTKLTSEPLTMDQIPCSSSTEYGACNIFLGRVRGSTQSLYCNKDIKGNKGHIGNKEIKGLFYDAFEPLVDKVFSDIATECQQKWQESMEISILHRKGWVAVGEISLILSVSTKHRKTSFEACQWMLEEIKSRAPIWKKQVYWDSKKSPAKEQTVEQTGEQTGDQAKEEVREQAGELGVEQIENQECCYEWLPGKSLRKLQ